MLKLQDGRYLHEVLGITRDLASVIEKDVEKIVKDSDSFKDVLEEIYKHYSIENHRVFALIHFGLMIGWSLRFQFETELVFEPTEDNSS